MKFLRTISLIVLAVALGVGVFVGDAQAAFLDSVRVATPASGGIRGIDSLIVARAYIVAGGTPLDSSLAVAFWLALPGDRAAALIDSTGSAARTPAEELLAGKYGVGGGENFLSAAAYVGAAENLVAADTFASINNDPAYQATVTWGPGPSYGAPGAGRGYIATLQLRVPQDRVGDVSGLTVWAVAYDATVIDAETAQDGYTPPVPGNYTFRVDGIRPYVDPDRVMLTGVTGTGDEERYVQIMPGGVPDTVRALRVGDEIAVEYFLAQSWQEIYALDLIPFCYLVYGGSQYALPSPGPGFLLQGGVLETEIWAGMTGDISPEHAPGYVEFYLQDPAGNLSSVYRHGPALPLTRTVDFLIDGNPPVLTAASNDTISPADGDTMTDGGVNRAMSRDDLNALQYKLEESLAELEIVFDNNCDDWDRTVPLVAVPEGAEDDPFLFGVGGLGAGRTHYLDVQDYADYYSQTSDPCCACSYTPTCSTAPPPTDVCEGYGCSGVSTPDQCCQSCTPGYSPDTYSLGGCPAYYAYPFGRNYVHGAAWYCVPPVCPPGCTCEEQCSEGCNYAEYGEPVDRSYVRPWTMAPLVTGTYTLRLTGRDFAGNVGPEREISNVYVDVDDIRLCYLFPSKAGFGTECEEDTISNAMVNFKLSEPAASVEIAFSGVSGADADSTRMRLLSGSELTNTAQVQGFVVPGLVDNTLYALTVIARDLAGNVMMSGPDTFYYDTDYAVPVIQRFAVETVPDTTCSTICRIAGDQVLLTIIADAAADTADTRPAYTYNRPVVVDVNELTGRGHNVTLTGKGVTALGEGRWALDEWGWCFGRRQVILTNTTAVAHLTVSVSDSSDAGNPYVGSLPGVIEYHAGPYQQIVVDAPASVNQGEEFSVGVMFADQYGNQSSGVSRYVGISVNRLGIEVPGSWEMLVQSSQGSFPAKATSWSGEGLVFTVKDLQDADCSSCVIRRGMSSAVTVVGGAAIVLDAPDTLDARDYMGADGLGDQGGFVLLTWDLSEHHGQLTGYRIYREMLVDTRPGGEGEPAIVHLDEPVADWVPWGKVDAVPFFGIGRAVVATLDNVASRWAIAAEMGSATTAAKEAFDGVESVGAVYDLMAQTMVESKKAAEQLVEGPVFATLTPEALAFVGEGLVPQFNSVAVNAVLSSMTETPEAVAAVDNIPPEPVFGMRAMDTPNDAGASITVSWTQSVSDALVSRNVPNAVGLMLGDVVPGVAGYNVYRQAGGGELKLVGKVSAGVTSFVDQTAANGVRYTYLVRPYDLDNEAAALVTRGAMAVRNNVVDAQGARILGLFGADNTVGFDDFFLFADEFGKTAENETLEPAFDLVVDGRVDFEDFFVFADNFGRAAAGAAGKVVPTLAGLNSDARLYLDAGSELPSIGSEVVIGVDLADYSELKGYGLNVSYDPVVLEFVRVVSEASLLGDGELAAPQVIVQRAGEVAVGAYGEVVTRGDLNLSLVFRTKTEIEGTYIEVTESQVRDGNYGVNQVALPAPVQIQTRPEVYALGNNYPNPFNPATTIRYALPEAAFVKLEVYNVVGQMVRSLVAGHQTAGRYMVQWDATNESGQALSSGIYFYRLQAGGDFLEVKKMLLLK